MQSYFRISGRHHHVERFCGTSHTGITWEKSFVLKRFTADNNFYLPFLGLKKDCEGMLRFPDKVFALRISVSFCFVTVGVDATQGGTNIQLFLTS